MSDLASLELKEIESPICRMDCFLKAAKDLKWGHDTVLKDLSALFEAIDSIAQAEVCYYYRVRRKRMGLSVGLRVAGLIFGSFGVLIPVLVATSHSYFKDWSPWGYVYLAIAACFFAANALFGATSGHVRFVNAQFSLERLITQTRLRWYEFYSGQITSASPGAEQAKTGFGILREYADAIYTTVIDETKEWAKLVQDELSKYQSDLDKRHASKILKGQE